MVVQMNRGYRSIGKDIGNRYGPIIEVRDHPALEKLDVVHGSIDVRWWKIEMLMEVAALVIVRQRRKSVGKQSQAFV